MGSGTWSASAYRSRASARRSTGTDAFEYSRSAMRSGVLKVHPTLDPYGLTYRESRDSAEHPNSNAIMIGLDETGSMTRVIREIHSDLPQLLELLLGHKYIPDPQIMFTAFGDVKSDQVPLQIGQFESDNRMDENLENMVLEGNGGPGYMESYELLLYVAARHTRIDCWDKRQRKGYLILIGDEMAYPAVSRQEVNTVIGSGAQSDIPLQQIIAEVRERYHLYFIIPTGAAAGQNPKIKEFWETHVGPQSVILLDDPSDVSETIALTIGLTEGSITVQTGIDHLRALGSSDRTLDTVGKALAHLPAGDATPGSTDLTTTDNDGDNGSLTRRL